MSKAKSAGDLVVNEQGATLRDVLGAMLRLPQPAPKHTRKTTKRKRKKG